MANILLQRKSHHSRMFAKRPRAEESAFRKTNKKLTIICVFKTFQGWYPRTPTTVGCDPLLHPPQPGLRPDADARAPVWGPKPWSLLTFQSWLLLWFPWNNLRKILRECQRMANLQSTNGIEILPKISTGWVGCTNVTDDRRQTDGR